MYGASEAPLPHGNGNAHGRLVAAIASFLNPNFYVELGCWKGDTFVLVEPYCAKAVAVDKEESMRGEFKELGLEKNFVCSDTLEFIREQKDHTIDLCFLDSSHQEEATVDEFIALIPKMVNNGVVLFHDSYPPNEEHTKPGRCGGVWKAIERLIQQFAQTFEFATLPSQYGLTIARKNHGCQVLWK